MTDWETVYIFGKTVTFEELYPFISYTNAKSEKGSARMKQILIVEDDTTMNKMLSNILLAEGYKVTSIFQRSKNDFLSIQSCPHGRKVHHKLSIIIYFVGWLFFRIFQQRKNRFNLVAQHTVRKRFCDIIGCSQFITLYHVLFQIICCQENHSRMCVFLDYFADLISRTIWQVVLEDLWDSQEKYVDEHTLTAAISRIRGKIEKDGKKYIQTVYGMGYMFTGGDAKP